MVVLSSAAFAGEEEPTAEEKAEIGRLLKRLKKGPGKRRAAAAALGRLGPKAKVAVEPLLVLVKADKNEAVRCTAAEALGRIDDGSPAVVRTLSGALSEDGELRRSAAMALGEFGPEASKAIRPLLKAAGSKHSETRREVYRALGRIGSDKRRTRSRILRTLRQGLKDSEKSARFAAAVALIRLDALEPELASVLKQAVGESPDRTVRLEAMEALGALGPDGAQGVPELITVLESEFERIPGMPYSKESQEQHLALRRAAARALGAIGPAAEAAIPALEKAAREYDPELKRVATEALKQIRG